jgi:TonB family protein
MNRLQKKCLIATAGFHLLLVLTIVFGSAFFTSRPKPDDAQLLDVIPANLIDAAFNSGVKAAPTPAPTPPQPVQQPPTPQPPQPKPVVTPPPPQPAPSLVQRVEHLFKPEPEKLPPDDTKSVEPAEKPAKPKHEIKVSMKPVVRTASKSTDTRDAEAARQAAKEANLRKAIIAAARAIKEHASSATTVEMPGTSSVSYANYSSVVKSVYERAWTLPDNTSSADANTRVSVTIGSDGTVISSRILDPSGDAGVDASVQRTLDRVTFVAPFPDGAKEKEKTFIINFNLKAKRNFG